MFKFSTVTVNKTVLRQGLHEQIIFFVCPYQKWQKKDLCNTSRARFIR